MGIQSPNISQHFQMAGDIRVEEQSVRTPCGRALFTGPPTKLEAEPGIRGTDTSEEQNLRVRRGIDLEARKNTPTLRGGNREL